MLRGERGRRREIKPTYIRRWGHSAAIRIAELVMQKAHMAVNDRIIVTATPGKIVIKRLPKEALAAQQTVETT